MKQQIKDFIAWYFDQHDFAPEVTEIADEIGVSRQCVYTHMKEMKDDLWEYHQYRRILK